jgi:hypothetical protein
VEAIQEATYSLFIVNYDLTGIKTFSTVHFSDGALARHSKTDKYKYEFQGNTFRFYSGAREVGASKLGFSRAGGMYAHESLKHLRDVNSFEMLWPIDDDSSLNIYSSVNMFGMYGLMDFYP